MPIALAYLAKLQMLLHISRVTSAYLKNKTYFSSYPENFFFQVLKLMIHWEFAL